MNEYSEQRRTTNQEHDQAANPERQRTGLPADAQNKNNQEISDNNLGWLPGVEIEPVPELEPKIYVASLTDYNHGILHGSWLNAELDPEQLYDKTKEMLAHSPAARRLGQPAEEWAIHDYEDFSSIPLSEHEDFATISQLARGLIDHGQAYAAWVNYFSKHSEQLEDFEDHYLGEYDSISDYAKQILDDLGYLDEIERLIPKYLKPYVTIDTSAFGRDLILSGDIWTQENETGRVWVFSSF